MQKDKEGTSGGVLAEAAVAMFLLTMMLIFVISLIQFAAAYHTMSQSLRTCMHVNMYRKTPSPVVYVQTEADYNNFSYPSQSTFEDCVDNPLAYPDCIHRVVHWKIRQHLVSNEPDIHDVTIATFWETVGIEELIVTVTAHYSSGTFFVDHEMSVASVADPCIALSPSPSSTSGPSLVLATTAPTGAGASPSPSPPATVSPAASSTASAGASPSPSASGGGPGGGSGGCWCDVGGGSYVCCQSGCIAGTCAVTTDPYNCNFPVPPPHPMAIACAVV